jgi:hypothetical protein
MTGRGYGSSIFLKSPISMFLSSSPAVYYSALLLDSQRLELSPLTDGNPTDGGILFLWPPFLQRLLSLVSLIR